MSRTRLALIAALLMFAAALPAGVARAQTDQIVGLWFFGDIEVEAIPNASGGFDGIVRKTVEGTCFDVDEQIWFITAKKSDNVYTGSHSFYYNEGCGYAGQGKTTWTLSEAGSRVDLLGESPTGDGKKDGYTMYKRIDCTDENTICGGETNDNIQGTSENDTIYAGGGDDEIDGGGGEDVIVGGEGNDTLTGGAANDQLAGGPGNDVLVGDGEIVDEGPLLSKYTLAFSLQDDAAGADTLEGGAGNDSVDGGDGDDNVQGGGGTDSVVGGTGNDKMDGQAGKDDLNGGQGGDVLNGGGAADKMNGAGGTDTCVLDTRQDSTRSCERKKLNFKRNGPVPVPMRFLFGI